jgi:hypothetical protein
MNSAKLCCSSEGTLTIICKYIITVKVRTTPWGKKKTSDKKGKFGAYDGRKASSVISSSEIHA